MALGALFFGAVLSAPVAHADGSNVISDMALRRCVASTMDGYDVALSDPSAPNGDDAAMSAWIASDAVSVSAVDLEAFASAAGGVQLWCPDLGITSLDGLQYLAAAPDEGHVVWANFSGNQISDASVLGGLTGLTLVDLTDNQISDAGFLATLPDLEQIMLSGNQITDIDGLGVSSPQGLWQLQAAGNQITDIGVLAGLAGLRDLDLSGNQISDVSPLAGLTQLTDVDLSSNLIGDVGSLADSHLPGLATLNLNDNGIVDVAAFALAQWPVLTEIDLRDNMISDVAGLGQGVFTDLEVLDLGGNSVGDSSHVSDLLSLASLIRLDLDGNYISDVTPLAALAGVDPDLRWLDLSGNEISDISPLLPYVQWMSDAWPASSGDSWMTDYPDYCADQPCLSVTLDSNHIIDVSGLPESAGYTDEVGIGVSLRAQNVDGEDVSVGETYALPVESATPGHEPLSWDVSLGKATLNSDGTFTFEESGPVMICWEDASIHAGTVDGDDGSQDTMPNYSGCVNYFVTDQVVPPLEPNKPHNGNTSQTGGSTVTSNGPEAALMLALALGLFVAYRQLSKRGRQHASV